MDDTTTRGGNRPAATGRGPLRTGRRVLWRATLVLAVLAAPLAVGVGAPVEGDGTSRWDTVARCESTAAWDSTPQSDRHGLAYREFLPGSPPPPARMPASGDRTGCAGAH
jgi:hypothetical protein